MEKENLTYTQAMTELEKIVAQLEDNSLDIDQLSAKVKRAQQLITFCRERLTQTDEEVKKLLQ